jgi:hypothetical protein
MMSSGAYVTHVTAERLRIKIPSRRRNAEFFATLRDSLAKIEGVESVATNPVTASILITHRTTIDAILEHGRVNNLFTLRKNSPRQTILHKTVTDGFSSLDNRIRKFTQGAFDGGGLAFLALAGIGIYQIGRGNFAAPAWYTAFWYAMNTFLKSNRGNSEDAPE